MHFSKTYSRLLLSLPPDLRDSAIEYRELKKLINQVVSELTSLGLSPQALHQVLEQSQSTQGTTLTSLYPTNGLGQTSDPLSKVTYELAVDHGSLQPQLRLWTSVGSSADDGQDSDTSPSPDDSSSEVSSTAGSMPPMPQVGPSSAPIGSHDTDGTLALAPEARETVVPLPSDSAFIQSLVHAHQFLKEKITSFCADFYTDLDTLSREISETARPMSEGRSSFHPYSADTDPTSVGVQPPTKFSSLFSRKSDLYAWREVLQLYVESEIFEDTHEKSRGERAITDAEERLATFMQRLSERGLSNGHHIQLPQSKHAMQLFLQLNLSILNLYKLQYATTEATRKILKKHEKRTALPFTASLPAPFDALAMIEPTPSALVPNKSQPSTNPLARTLVQAIGESVLPIVPSVEDYSCIICLNIAFKPIRLSCGHLFCVRCLAKMQKRGQAMCPMCRSPCVLVANRTNVDWALLNFMKDWFPIEASEKLKANEAEVAEEQMKELGFENRCVLQ